MHELVGHGLVAIALGGRITSVKLFYFAGGYVDPTWSGHTDELLITLGGAVSVTLAAVPILAFTRDRLVHACGAAAIAQSCWYISAGTWMGFGDGTILFTDLHDAPAARYGLCVVLGIAAIAAAYLGGHHCAGTIVAAAPSRRHAIAACVIAFAVNAVPGIAEPHLRTDETYEVAMQTEHDRLTEAHVPDAPERPIPFNLILAGCIYAAGIAGMLRSAPREPRPITTRQLRVVAIVAAVSLAMVIAIDSLAG